MLKRKFYYLNKKKKLHGRWEDNTSVKSLEKLLKELKKLSQRSYKTVKYFLNDFQSSSIYILTYLFNRLLPVFVGACLGVLQPPVDQCETCCTCVFTASHMRPQAHALDKLNREHSQKNTAPEAQLQVQHSTGKQLAVTPATGNLPSHSAGLITVGGLRACWSKSCVGRIVAVLHKKQQHMDNFTLD